MSERLQLVDAASSSHARYMPSSSSIEDPSQEDAMQALIARLQQIQTTPSTQLWDPPPATGINWAINYLLLELDTLIRFLREKRLLAEQSQADVVVGPARSYSFEDEKQHKMLLYARKEWRDVQKKAVRLNVADLVVSFLPPVHASSLVSIRSSEDLLARTRASASDVAAPHSAPPPKTTSPRTTSSSSSNHPQTTAMEDKLLELIYEFIAGGCLAAQNALFDAIRDDTAPFTVFLMRHLKRRHESSFVLLVLQQLCENHQPQWQALMRANDISSFLHVSTRQLLDIYWADVPLPPADTSMLLRVLAFFAETCQGPCVENQDALAQSPAAKLCCDLVLGRVRYEANVPTDARRAVQQAATDVLLSLMEGRTDTGVQNQLAEWTTADRVLQRLVGLFHVAADENGVLVDEPAFEEAIHVLHVVSRMTNTNVTADSSPPQVQATIDDQDVHLAAFADSWDDLRAKFKAQDALACFEREMASVQVSRLGATFTVYFVKPKWAKRFDKGLRKRFLNSMNIGADDSLYVLVSDPAQHIQEELQAMRWLEKIPVYALLSEWHWQLRVGMLYLCAYINFVLIMTLKQKDNMDTPLAKVETLEWLLHLLGVGLLAVCATLFAFHFTQTLAFSYAKQQVSVLKLQLATPTTIRRRLFRAFSSLVFYLQLFVSTFAIIVFLYSTDDATTQTLGSCAIVVLVLSFLAALRDAAGTLRFVVSTDATYREMKLLQNWMQCRLCFWYSVLYDTLFAGPVMLFGLYTLCAFLALQDFTWAPLFYGFPLVDILETNERLNFIALAMRSNLGKLGVTAVFGAIAIYIFSLVGFYLLQHELQPDDATQSHCASLLQCFATYIRYGLLSGGGIGDYISSTLNHELDFAMPNRYFERLVYDMAFYVVVITLFLNMIQGIIIDAFTAEREASETKTSLKRERCLVCNRPRSAIEAAGMEKGKLNNFARHTVEEHNLFHYFFFIQHVRGKADEARNGLESYVFEKLHTKDMSWIPRV
ncbi:Aste57867_19349 [Aphanomyces stellatus]|uniref:Aste57867_19349 protein n=1 Tax=Aphanomyces stellatus TaxID=120398 RepID=A0A485LE04_9STRA|nr:hypothetical protein As57867_019285 [Aphanomyces stellatus]VFT96063.1 Aste57867_19349 [Aphanomyces stellatus]